MPYAFDPELAPIVPHLRRTDPRDVEASRAAMRQLVASWPAADTTGLVIEDRLIPGPAGAPDVTVRLYIPERPQRRGCVYDIHGGGFRVGDLETDHHLNVQLAQDLGVLVVGVDYRLSPETQYPGALEDVYAGLVWISEHADALNIDPACVVIHGQSAGATLAAGVALLARDQGGPAIAFQFLGIPGLDDRLGTVSARDYDDTPVWSRPLAELAWDDYLGYGRRGGGDVDAHAAPARAENVTGLPAAYISVMQFDPSRDAGIAYASALLAAGVPTELHVFPGTFHGSRMINPSAQVSLLETAEEIAVIRRALDAASARSQHPGPMS